MLKEVERQATEREVKIIEVHSSNTDQKPVKTNGRYSYRVTYVLEDGREIKTSNSKQLLRDAKQALKDMPYQPKGLFASFSKEGDFWGTSQTFSLFG